ncbi:hypothetical protein HW450_08500 [Corynebacterium hindlerae]|uniref:Uncharacterized protein n=1 Tax=Corynebacterium hindlerae TaxID=699041 RepID=A0A7G5FCR5_9CORY|nr:hypothetical protein [Corynebacterium hindlerae]QMV84406.1 hypothetical protein HW450_08500 [Corynebacterium hindlerae]
MNVQLREATRSFVTLGLLAMYLLLRAVVLVDSAETAFVVWLMIGCSVAAWLSMWVLLRPLAPIAMSISAASYIVGMLIRAGHETHLWAFPMEYGATADSWPFAQLMTVVAYALLAYVVWKHHIGHRFLHLHIMAFIVLVVIRTVATDQANLGLFTSIVLLRDLIGGTLYIALAITFYLYGRQCLENAKLQQVRELGDSVVKQARI